MVHSSLEAAKILEQKNISCAVVNMHTITSVHPKAHIEKIFKIIPKKGLVGIEKAPAIDPPGVIL